MELLSPAGDLEKVRTALLFGADAIYVGIQGLSLRAAGLNITELHEAVALAHGLSKRIYAAINIFAQNQDIDNLQKLLPQIQSSGVDAVIVSDPGIIALLREKAPGLKIHLSTQANTTNWQSVKFWQNQGVSRIVLARELSIDEIMEIRQKVPGIELEIFVHGAMCMAFSGRCLLSMGLTGRNANRGECAQPCRWEYTITESAPTRDVQTEEMTIGEDDRGSYILNSRDLCLINKIPELIEAGIDSIKIEGRMKPAYYVALATKSYREAIDLCKSSAERPETQLQALFETLHEVSHRPFTTGFTFPDGQLQETNSAKYIKPYDFVGVVSKWEDGKVYIAVRNRISSGEVLEFIDPRSPILTRSMVTITVENICNTKTSEQMKEAHNTYEISLPAPEEISAGSIVRKKARAGL
ncbi:MAG: U32 family peptidase [Candidatus Margulisiibacteriota bacterium]|jgi:putative protease